MLRVSEIKPPLDHGADALKSALQKKLRVGAHARAAQSADMSFRSRYGTMRLCDEGLQQLSLHFFPYHPLRFRTQLRSHQD